MPDDDAQTPIMQDAAFFLLPHPAFHSPNNPINAPVLPNPVDIPVTRPEPIESPPLASEASALATQRSVIANQSESISNFNDIKASVVSMQATLAHQIDTLARIGGALRALECPLHLQVDDPTNKDGVRQASVGDCLASGACGCQIGYALEAVAWTPAS